MPRLPRHPLDDVPPHVLPRGHHRQPLFLHQEDDRVYWPWLPAAATVSVCAMHVSALMTHHVALLLTPHQAASLTKGMPSLGRRHVPDSNTTSQRTGPR